ncbi:MAG: hypothetical protein ACXVA9_04060 [Bdellovibrionales bacterium]
MNLTAKILCILSLCVSLSAQAAERMIAYGYTNCVACHVNLQGRNILTEYGNSIDEAQSLRAGEFKRENSLFMLDGKVNQIVRGYLNQTVTRKDKATTTVQTFEYLNYQNATQITPKTTVTFGLDWRQPSEQPAAVTPYYTAPERAPFFLDYAFLKYVPSDGFAIVAGKDQLPTGVNNGDAAQFVHSRNSLANNERPIQLKTFWWAQKYLVSAYVYQPNGGEAPNMGERGYGIMGETDLYNNRTVVGVNLLSGTSNELNRQMAGLYARIGFMDTFGILGEVDQTWRKFPDNKNFNQTATLAQVFYTPLEWVVWYAGYEYLNVALPADEYQSAYSGKLSLRLSRNFTMTASLRHSEKARINTEVSQLVLFAKY